MRKQVRSESARQRTARAARQTVPSLQMGLFARIFLEDCQKKLKTHISHRNNIINDKQGLGVIHEAEYNVDVQPRYFQIPLKLLNLISKSALWENTILSCSRDTTSISLVYVFRFQLYSLCEVLVTFHLYPGLKPSGLVEGHQSSDGGVVVGGQGVLGILRKENTGPSHSQEGLKKASEI